MRLFNAWFNPHFPDPEQKAVKPQQSGGVERWISIPPPGKKGNKVGDGYALASGIRQLRSEGIRYCDMAVLASTNSDITSTTEVLKTHDIPFQIESPGLFSTREGLLLLSGLRLVANRNDSLAAATILHWIDNNQVGTPTWLTDRLTEITNSPIDPESGRRLYQKPFIDNPILKSLEKIEPASLAPSLVVLQVIEALALATRVQNWGEPSRRCSNLDSASRHAQEFEEYSLSGVGSATLTGLIVYFEELASQQLDYCYPSEGHDAVSVLTYHRAKGLEWPVVIFTGIGKLREVDVWRPTVESVRDPMNPLANRRIRYWPWPFGYSESDFQQKKSGTGLENDALTSMEALEQQEKDLKERKRLLYVGCTRAKTKLVFSHRLGQTDWLDLIPEINQTLDQSLEPGQYDLKDYPDGYVVRHFCPDQETDLEIPPEQDNVFWISAVSELGDIPQIVRYHAPSSAESRGESKTRLIELDNQPFFPDGADEVEFSAMGDAVHHYLAALPSLAEVGVDRKQEVATRCVLASDVAAVITPEALVHAGDRFQKWIQLTFPGAVWHVEVPASGKRSDGGEWIGTIDLLLELHDGEFVLVDHKSAPIRRNHCESKAIEYSGQLNAYQEILFRNGVTVKTKYVHFALAGNVVEFQE